MTWRLDKWCAGYTKDITPMTKDEQKAAITYLRSSKYEKPEDCPWDKCSMKRPACSMNICVIATKLAGDF